MVSSKGPDWMGICHHEQDIGPPSGFVFTAQGVTPGYLIVHVVVCNIKIEFSVCRLKINHAWSTPSCV